MGARSGRIGMGLILAAGMLVSGAPVAAPASAGSEALPDLAVAPLTEFRIQWSGGRRLLRFTAMFVNVGAWAFEVRGGRSSASQPMAVRQVLYQTSSRSSPVSRELATSAVAQYSGDGHNHWHVQEMMRYDLWGSSGTIQGAKVGFCFLDSDPYNLSLPGAIGSPHYPGSACGTNPNALSNRMGLSIGWGDKYGWNLAYQWVDITGLPSGSYTVRAMADPNGFFVESNEANQCAFVTLSISQTSNHVQATGTGNACVNDWSNSEFAPDVAWAFQNGVTLGCTADMFCTNNRVSREQMASFLARALGLGPTPGDYFVDDESSGHEDNINRIAAGGITVGCAAYLYCPKNNLNRQQMATFLARAFSLAPTGTDFFTDDEGSQHEDNINRVAAAGITLGCAPGRFCPNGIVTRGQMAAFLHRAMT